MKKLWIFLAVLSFLTPACADKKAKEVVETPEKTEVSKAMEPESEGEDTTDMGDDFFEPY